MTHGVNDVHGGRGQPTNVEARISAEWQLVNDLEPASIQISGR